MESEIYGIEKLLQKLAPTMHVVGGDVVTEVGRGAPVQREPAEPSRDWASLPPIQRTAGAMPLVAAPATFTAALPGITGLPPIVEQLGHEVSPLATPGLVVARVRQVPAPSSGAIPAPVQRRASRGSSAPEQATPASAAVAEAAPPVAPAPVAAAEAFEPSIAAPPVAVAAAEAPAVQPIRSIPTVSRLSVRVPDRPLTSAAMAARPAAVQRAEAAEAAAIAIAGALPRQASGSGMRRVPTSAAASMPVVGRQAAALPAESAHPEPAPALSAPSASPATVSVATSTSTSGSSPAPAPAASLPTPPRLGLGEPLLALPSSARPMGSASPAPIVSRSTTAGPMPLAVANLLPLAQRATADGGATSSLPVAAGESAPSVAARSMPQPTSAAVQRLPELPHLPVARSSAARAAQQRSSASPTTTPTTTTQQTPPAHAITTTASTTSTSSAPAGSTSTPAVQTLAAPEIRPIAGANPIRPSFVLQRSAADAEDQDEAPDDAALPSPWWAPAEAPRAAPEASAATGADAGSPSIQRTASWDRRSTPSGNPFGSNAASSAGGPLARYAAAVQTSRAAASGAAVQRSGAPANRAALPPARGSAPDAGARSAAVASSAVPSASAVSAATAPNPFGVVSAPVVQTSPAASTPGSGHTPTVQRLDSPPTSTPVGPAGASGSGAQSSAKHSERDLDELAQALFSRIRGRLRSDLIHDREAKGLTFDNV